MNASTAEFIHDLLVYHVGASGSQHDREQFVRSQVDGCREYRFQGSLGFGGKFWNTPGGWYVTCYAEDETVERREAMDQANKALASLRDSVA